MSPSLKNRTGAGRRRGHATIVAIALALALLVVVAAIVRLVAVQFAATKPERDSERALQMAEAGANAYVNMLTHGPAASTVTNYQLIPPQYVYSTVLTPQQFKIEAQNGSSAIIPRSSLIHYPIGNATQGYCAYQTQAITTSGGGSIVAFGWSNGIVRRVKLGGQVRGLFDVPAVYGLNPADALDLKNIKITGSWGGEGDIDTTGSTGLTGPTYLAAAGATANPPPTGWPSVTYNSRSLGIPTADQAANQWAFTRDGVTTALGVEYFRTHNNNATNIKYLVQDKSTHVIRELPGDASWTPSGTTVTFSTSNTPAGKTGNETVFGIRMYPGDYYFTDIQHNGVTIYGRNYADGGQPASDPINPFMATDPNNPVTAMAPRTDIRIWIGNTSSGTQTSLHSDILVEDSRYPDRFRLYDANTGGLVTKQATLNMSVLVYNKTALGAGYGSVDIETQSAITGSVIGWNVGDHGNSITVNKGTPDPGNTDGFLFSITNWKELP